MGGSRPAIGQRKSGLQVPQRQGADDWTVDLGSSLGGDGLAVAHVKAHERGHGVKGIPFESLQHKLDVRFAALDQHLGDARVLHLVVPAAGQSVVAHVGQRVAHQEVPVTQDQRLRHLKGRKRAERSGEIEGRVEMRKRVEVRGGEEERI